MNVHRTAATALPLMAIIAICFLSYQLSNAQNNPLNSPPVASQQAASMPASGTSRPAPGREGWQLVWSDEFDHEGLPDPKKWTYEVGFVRNQEKQYYTQARKENGRVEHGELIIEGRKEHFPNAQYDPKTEGNWQKDRKNADYTSASITTEGKASWIYGRIEVRAKLPQGKGVWPAIWTLGTGISKVGWPRCGEIDIMEFVGHQPDKVHGTIHYGLDGKHQSQGDKLTVDKPWEDFHVYAIEWEADRIDFFFDDTKYFTFKTPAADSDGSNAFRQPHYLLLNLALGGSWGGQIDDNVLPQQFVIDYVRVYQRPGTTTTSCPTSRSALGGGLTIVPANASIKTAGSKLVGYKTQEGDWNLSSNGEVGELVNFAADGKYKVVVRAGGTPAKGVGPAMAIMVDGRQAATASVNTEGFADYTFDVSISAGTHRFTVAFLNDAVVPDPDSPKKWLEDRNLFLGRIAIAASSGGKDPTLGSFEDWAKEATKREEKTLADTARQIEQNRKGDAVVHVVDSTGKPIPNATVVVDLLRHEFLFGCNIFGFDHFKTPAKNELYKQRFSELFNYATLGFYWRWYAPEQGKPNYAYTDKVVGWCLEHNIRMKGHPLLWGTEAGIPTWSKGQPTPELQKRRVTEIMQRYSGKIMFWEVVNEPTHEESVTIDQPYRWARQADPKAQLIVNDYQVLGDGYPPFFELLTKAEAQGVPFDGIGIQAHEPLGMRFPLDSIKEILDRYATLGKALYITEFTPTSGGQPITGSHITGKWDEKAQEDWATKFYRVCFAQAAVKGITWWDLCEEGSWQPGGGLLHKDLTPKPVYESLKKLIHQEWHTKAQGQTDADGKFAFRGFHGNYEVTVTTGDKTAKVQFDLSGDHNGKMTTCTVTLP
jgi:beta-glucanase (GH16 family)/GH35 family endo-1,4-beta-xylanase